MFDEGGIHYDHQSSHLSCNFFVVHSEKTHFIHGIAYIKSNIVQNFVKGMWFGDRTHF